MREYAQRIDDLRRDHTVAIVTSGAVALGESILRGFGRTAEQLSVVDDQTKAAVGSAEIVSAWGRVMAPHGVPVAQGLVTHHEMKDKEEGSNLTVAYMTLESDDVLPVFNQNDLLVDKKDEENELEKIDDEADNDWLAADLAVRVGAKALILCMHDREGFEIENGIVKPQVSIAELEELAVHIKPSNGRSKGGIRSKIRAAGWADSHGVQSFVCNAYADYQKVLTGHGIGTRVVQ